MSNRTSKYRHPPLWGPLDLLPDCLCFFIDDTGHERLKGDHTIYGLGGCAIVGRDYQHVLCDPWKRRRAGTMGSFDSPLRAATFGRMATPANMAAMARFFARQKFFRLAAVATRLTEFPSDHELMVWVLQVLKTRIVEILNRTTATSVALVFESSDRADSLLISYFGTLDLWENGKQIPVEHCLLSKSAAEPGLEVADFVMHAVGRMARRRLEGKHGFPADFAAVFHRCLPNLTSFMIVDRIEPGPDEVSDIAVGMELSFAEI